MDESLAVQPKETNFILPGMAENLKNELQAINKELIFDEEQKATEAMRLEAQRAAEAEHAEAQRAAEAERARAQIIYDRMLTCLAAKWFEVKKKAVHRLDSKHKKALEALILRKAEEKRNAGGIVWFLWRKRLPINCVMMFLWLTSVVVLSLMGGTWYFVGGFCGAFMIQSFIVTAVEDCFREDLLREIESLLESKKLLDAKK